MVLSLLTNLTDSQMILWLIIWIRSADLEFLFFMIKLALEFVSLQLPLWQWSSDWENPVNLIKKCMIIHTHMTFVTHWMILQ